MLVENGIDVIVYYHDISFPEQYFKAYSHFTKKKSVISTIRFPASLLVSLIAIK